MAIEIGDTILVGLQAVIRVVLLCLVGAVLQQNGAFPKSEFVLLL